MRKHRRFPFGRRENHLNKTRVYEEAGKRGRFTRGNCVGEGWKRVQKKEKKLRPDEKW